MDSGVVSANAWHTVIAWHDAAHDTINIQVDNGTVNAVSYASGTADSSNPLSIGAFPNGGTGLDGRIDEVAIYKRVLTPEERAWLYNSGQGRVYAEVNLPFPGAVTYGYGDVNHDHAVTSLSNGNAYEYDANGNMTKRVIGADTYLLSYDAENRLVEVKKNSVSIASFVYDGDGKRVKSTLNGVTTTFVGSHYEITGSTVTKYYFAGATRVAMRVNGTLTYLFSDHLGSTSLTLDADGDTTSEIRYDAWGKVRYSSGTTPTDYTFTGQYSDSYINLLDYGSRHYDPELGRFIQPDSIVPFASQGVQAWDRYGYANNNPVRFSDPSGHRICDYNCQIEYEGADPAYKHYGESLSCWGPTECWGVKPNTVVSKALAGDSSAIINAVLPTTGGVRGQLEIVPKEPICFLGVCVPVSVTLGLNIVANRIDGEISGSVDFSPELGPALQPDPLLPVDVSVTGGPMFTWFSSDAQQVTTGDSTVMSATVAAGEAYSAAIVTSPLGVPPDPMYGVKPVTLYAGVLGAGTGYASIGGGISHTLYETSFNFYGLFR